MSEHEALMLGAKIQNARRSTGKELSAIASEICVSKSYLVAIEEGRFEALPVFPFAIGFVRSFASEVGLQAAEIAREFKAIVQPAVIEQLDEELGSTSRPGREIRNTSKSNASKRGPIYGGLAVVLSAISAVWMIFTGGGQQAAYVKSAPQADTVQLASAKVQDVFQEAAVSTEPANKNLPDETVVTARTDFSPAGNQLMGVANADDEGAGGINLQVNDVMFEARQDAWVRISSGDQILFEGVLTAGDHYVPPMGPSLNLTTSNAGALALHIGEHDLGVLGAKGGIIENVNIDPDSLILRLVETL